MTAVQLAVVGVWLASIWSAALILLYGCVLLSRARFVNRLTVLRADLVFDVLSGKVTDSPQARSFVEILDWFMEEPRRFTVASTVRMRLRLEKAGVDVDDLVATNSYADLPPADRKQLHCLEAELSRDFSRLMRHGSVFALLVILPAMHVKALKKVLWRRAPGYAITRLAEDLSTPSYVRRLRAGEGGWAGRSGSNRTVRA